MESSVENLAMNRQDLPERWKLKIKEYLTSKGSKYDTLSAGDFLLGKVVEIEFEDGSFAKLNNPLIIEAPEFQEVGIMTEHCGYFIFHQESITYNLK